MRYENLDQWAESDWLKRLNRRAQQLTRCADDAADLAHDCLYAFYNRFHRFPWQHSDPKHAWHWCCQKLRSLWLDTRRHAQRHPLLPLDELPESIAQTEFASQIQEDTDGEAFVASLPKSLREPLQLLLQGYSWEEAARQLGKKSGTLRGYLPVLRAKFVAFFGYVPSKGADGSLMEAQGANQPLPSRSEGRKR